MSEVEFFSAREFALQKGGVLPEARLAFQTFGKLSAARDNVIVSPTWYSGDHSGVVAALVGPDRALNPEKYFIVIPNLLAGGVSTSPSNAPAPFDRACFPNVTLFDNVRLQRMMLRELFHVERVKLVAGWSMGGCQSFQWAAQYPDEVEAIVALCGSARTAHFNKVFLVSLKRALELDPAFARGFYSVPPLDGLKAFAAIYAGWGFSEPFYRNEEFRKMNATTSEEFVKYYWEPAFIHHDANNLLAMLWTWFEGDISDNEIYKRNFELALRSIKARTFILPGQYDSYFPPTDSAYEASLIPGAICRPIPSTWGHMTLWNPEDRPFIDAALHEALGNA
jgi:homoserine O-acetyltransferase/O-succinyltransferase